MDQFNYTNVIVFGGTTEGRLIAEKLNQNGCLACVCVATDYGETFLGNIESVKIGRLDSMQMITLFSEIKPTLVIDATHPYATDVTKNIISACNNVSVPYIRIKREDESVAINNAFYFNTLKEMITWLNTQDGIIFSTLGVKEASHLTNVNNYNKRLFIRVLPTEDSLKICYESGFERSHIIAAMGPFSCEENVESFTKYNADILLTKESGKAGGFKNKIDAAIKCNMKIAVLKRPLENNINVFLSCEDMLTAIEKWSQND